MNATNEIGLWYDLDGGRWVVSRDDGQVSVTVATFPGDDYADAMILAKDEAYRTGRPLVATDEHGVRETICVTS